jgi:hypothetical protein
MAKKKYKQAFERDWNFYCQNKDKFNFSGGKIPIIISDPEGKDAKRVFHRYDSQGKMMSCKEPELLEEIFACKVAVNMHLKVWADGYTDVAIPAEELLKEFIDPPEWVGESLRNQIKKKLLKEFNRE